MITVGTVSESPKPNLLTGSTTSLVWISQFKRRDPPLHSCYTSSGLNRDSHHKSRFRELQLFFEIYVIAKLARIIKLAAKHFRDALRHLTFNSVFRKLTDGQAMTAYSMMRISQKPLIVNVNNSATTIVTLTDRIIGCATVAFTLTKLITVSATTSVPRKSPETVLI